LGRNLERSEKANNNKEKRSNEEYERQPPKTPKFKQET